MNQALGRPFAVMENHPDLKANENVLHLQKSLSSLEEEVPMDRRYCNATARDLNIVIQSFPSSIIARRYGFENADFFKLENAAEAAVPQVSF